MVRHYRRVYRTRRSRPLKTVKYSSETATNNGIFTQNEYTGSVYQLAIPPVTTQGVRKAKNFRLSIAWNHNVPVCWALVYVPEGNTPQSITYGTGQDKVASLYEPNQNVIMSGITQGSGPFVYRTRLARNLNSGDRIYIVWRLAYTIGDNSRLPMMWQLNYAISF